MLSSLVLSFLMVQPAPLLPQAAGQNCITKHGRKVCGYDCKEAYGLIRCAKTPQGRCSVSYGTVKCWDPPTGGTGKVKGAAARGTCISSYGRTVCGYGCAKGWGQVRCAQTPGARCWKEYGRIKCSDDLKHHFKRPPPPGGGGGPRAQCISKYGRTVCGYGCIAQYGQVKCARTPAGVCYAKFGQVKCWDPRRVTAGQEKAQCLSQYGRIACGYDCKAEFGQIKCAKTPRGVCKAAYGKITCWDPPPLDSKKKKRAGR